MTKKASRIHDSDCALHNAPALPVGECDCSISAMPVRIPLAVDVKDARHYAAKLRSGVPLHAADIEPIAELLDRHTEQTARAPFPPGNEKDKLEAAERERDEHWHRAEEYEHWYKVTQAKLEAAEREIVRLRAKLEPHADEVCIKQDKWEEELSYAESQRERIASLEAENAKLREALEAICTHFDTDRLAKNIARAALQKDEGVMTDREPEGGSGEFEEFVSFVEQFWTREADMPLRQYVCYKKAASRIQSLERQLEEAKEQAHYANGTAEANIKRADEAEDRLAATQEKLEAAERENERLRKALRPFADKAFQTEQNYAARYQDIAPASEPVLHGITLGPCRVARAALQKDEGEAPMSPERDIKPDNAPSEGHYADRFYNDALEEAAKVADHRADIWRKSDGQCAFSLEEECEDIAAAIRVLKKDEGK